MCHWKKWIWPGILTVAILSLLAIWMKRDFIQDDLKTKAASALSTSGQSWASVEMDGRDATLTGEAPGEEAGKQAEKIVSEAYKIRVVDNQSGLVAAQSPYTFTAKLKDKTVDLSGFVPNNEVRGTIVDTAKELLPNTEITDSTAIARGQPDNMELLAGFGLTQLAGLSEGEVSLSDKALSISGVAKDQKSYDAINTALDGEMPDGGTVASKDITPPSASPYQWSADYSGDEVVLSGFVPSQDVREGIINSTKSALPDVKVVDNQQLATGAPADFEKAANYAIQQLPRFKSGKVGLTDSKMSVSGVANSSENYTAALGAVGAAALPAGIALANSDINPATVSPYTWEVRYEDGKATLNGFIPDNATRHAIVGKAKASLGTDDVTDNMQIADGAAADFSDKTDFAFELMPHLSSGTANISDNQFSINGVALDVENYKAANAMVDGNLPAGLSLKQADISPATISPYKWSAERENGKITLSGFVPDEAARTDINSAVKDLLPDAEITDSMQIAAGSPEAFTEASRFGVSQLAHLAEGTVSLEDLDFAIKGVASDSASYNTVNTAVSGALPAEMKLASSDITPPTATPYSWGAGYDGDTVTLTGFVPDTASREKLVAVVQENLPEAKVVDNMQIAAGAPELYDTATKGAIAVLPRFSKGNVALSGTNLSVNGTGKTSSDYLAAEQYVGKELPEGVNLAIADIVPPAHQGDYGWEAKKTGSQIVLSGLVPSKEDSQKLADRAVEINPGASVDNRLTIKTGAPDNFASNADLGLSLLTGLRDGTAVITNENLVINGVANTAASYEKTTEMMKDVKGVIQPPVVTPYSWAVKNDSDSVILEGFVPDAGTGNTNISASKAVIDKPVDDRQRLATGAPEGFANAAAALIAGVDRLDNSYATITDQNVFLQGRAKSEDEATKIGDEIEKSLPKNFNFRRQISFPLPEVVTPPAAPSPCDVDFTALFNGEKIHFEKTKADINPESYPLLDRIAKFLKECKTSRVEIGGHTDARGSEEYNQELSEARAQAVLAYLIKIDGISKDKLVAKGYGESKQIAPNTEEEREKNRRIEFTVLDK